MCSITGTQSSVCVPLMWAVVKGSGLIWRQQVTVTLYFRSRQQWRAAKSCSPSLPKPRAPPLSSGSSNAWIPACPRSAPSQRDVREWTSASPTKSHKVVLYLDTAKWAVSLIRGLSLHRLCPTRFVLNAELCHWPRQAGGRGGGEEGEEGEEMRDRA